MKEFKLPPYRSSPTRYPDGHLIPDGIWIPIVLAQKLMKTERPFLQYFLDWDHLIRLCIGELTLYIGNSLFWIKVFDDHILLEYMATYPQKRQKGSATQSLKLICKTADATNTTLKLTTDVVIYPPGKGRIPVPHAITEGIKGEARIPASKLVEWFQKFGFVQGEPSTDPNVDYQGYHMVRTPQSIKE